MEYGDILKDFLVESREYLGEIERILLSWEQNPQLEEEQDEVYRYFHTLKGMAGCFGFPHMANIVHRAEDFIEMARENNSQLNSRAISSLLEITDLLWDILSQLEEEGEEPSVDYEKILARYSLDSENILSQSPVPPDPSSFSEESINTEDQASSPRTSDQYLRISPDLLDRLMEDMEELVLTRNHLASLINTYRQPRLATGMDRLENISSRLQEGIMEARLQPLAKIWKTFPRMVRDEARTLEKEIDLLMEGKETEIDKSLLENIRELLTHLIRNAIDHAIELPEERKKAGKPPEGKIALKAYSNEGWIFIEVSDDGRGISGEAIRQKALESEVLDPEEIRSLSVEELSRLIFLPGFSTASHLTHLSGRGVGLDVVKARMEEMGGKVELKTTPGQGTTFRLKLPLTLAISPVLIVRAGGRSFALPQNNLEEMFYFSDEEFEEKTKSLYDAPLFSYRGRELPLLYLTKALELEVCREREGTFVIILDGGEFACALVVDEIVDIREVVLRPLSQPMKKMGIYSGVSLLGEGEVILVLDLMGLAHRLGLLLRDSQGVREDWEPEEPSPSSKDRELLLFRAGERKSMAVFLSSVLRTDVLKAEDIRREEGYLYCLYQGKITPLIDIVDYFDLPCEDTRKMLVLCRHQKCSLGLVVGEISDLLTLDKPPQKCINRPGLWGSLYRENQVVEVVDIPYLIRELDPPLFTTS